MNEILTPILAQLTRGTELSADAIDAALGELFEGRVSDVQAAAFIVALRTKGETEDELAALVRTMHRYGTPVEVPDGAIDTCGTGGDRSGTVNVSTMAALDRGGRRRAGREARQPRRVVAGRLGRRARGARRRDRPRARRVSRSASRKPGVGFCFAPRYHPAMRFLGPARKEIGVPTTFNFLGPLANPARVRRQAVGVSDATMATRMLGTLRALGTERAMVFSGDDGLDELTTTTTSTVHELTDGALHEYSIDPLDLGIARAEPAQLVGGDATTNAAMLARGARGREGPAPRPRGAQRGRRARGRGHRPRSRGGRRGRGARRSTAARPSARSKRSCA